MLIAMLVLAGTPASTERLAVTMLALGLVGTVVGWGAIMVAARSVSDPVKAMRAALARVEEGDTTVQTPVYDASEIGLLQAGFNRMVAGLRERELLRDLFGRHVGEDVARNALDRGLELGGETREVAVLFVDLIGSTAMAAKREPAEVVATLNAFFSIVVEEVSVRGGWVNKFEGDAALCVFGAPTGHPSAAASALAAGRALHDRLARELPEADAGIGLSAGSVVAGNVGAAERFEYTVIGDPVNEAARLTELAKGTPARLLASEAILERAGAAEAGRWELGEQVTLRGRDRVTRLATPR
jgi:adenylate cyclase